MHRGALENAIARRFAPFAAVGLLALTTAALPPRPTSWWLVAGAAALSGAIVAVAFLVPWSRLPRWTYVVPALAYFVVIGLLREAQGGPTSGYAALAILPILWIALTLRRREVIIGILGGVALYLAPLLGAGGSTYTAAEWRRIAIWIGVSLIVGLSTESLVRRARAQAEEARRQADALAESERTMTAIARMAREAQISSDSRELVCQAALDVAEASVATITEPDGDWLVVTASAGLSQPPIRVFLGESPSGSELVLATGSRLFVPDVAAEPGIATRLAGSAPGVVSALYEPIVRGGTTIGVLAVGWPERVDDLGHRRAAAVSLLAAEAAAAVERSDLLARLSLQSLTDELTGLPNRRAWEQELPRALARAQRSGAPVSVALLDLDRFKTFNDTHGHQAGDALLRHAAASWERSLRDDDVLARYGGEEFAALLPGCDLGPALAAAERMRVTTPQGQTCSAGVATWDRSEGPLELVGRADAALYEAKRTGRDHVEASPTPDHPPGEVALEPGARYRPTA